MKQIEYKFLRIVRSGKNTRVVGAIWEGEMTAGSAEDIDPFVFKRSGKVADIDEVFSGTKTDAELYAIFDAKLKLQADKNVLHEPLEIQKVKV